MSKSDAKKSGRHKKKGKNEILSGTDDEIDYEQSTWSTSPPKTITGSKKRSFDYPSPKASDKNKSTKKNSTSVPNTPDLDSQHKSQQMMFQQLNNRSKKQTSRKKKTKTHKKAKSALPNKKKEKKKWSLRSRTSDPSTQDLEELKKTDEETHQALKNGKNTKNLIIKINHINKTDKNKKKLKNNHKNNKNVIFDVNAQQQILGDILIHVSAWNQLISKNDANKLTQKREKNILNVGWKKIYSVLDQQTLRFWDNKQEDGYDTKEMDENNNICIYLSEILTLNKSIRAIDGKKYIIELNVSGIKCLLSFANIEQREYWHSLLSDYHLNYFVWRSTPLDEKERRSQNVINGVYKLLKSQKSQKHSNSAKNMDTLNILYIEEILQKISALNITQIIDIVPETCKFMSGRLVRVIMSIKFFFMSVLKSLSGADIPLPSRDILINYLDEIAVIKWANTSVKILDFYCDKCYRILFNLSFAFTSNARDEIMKLNEFIDTNNKTKNVKNEENNYNDIEKKIAGMKFEYESLQRSWKMHRDRLQEYVMAYRDAVAKLKHSYHQRDSLCKKIDTLQKDKKQLNESIELQNETYKQTMQEAQKLTQKFSILSQQMQEMQMQAYAPYQQYPQYAQMQAYSTPYQQQYATGYNNNNNYQPGSEQLQQLQQQLQPPVEPPPPNDDNASSQIQQISQEMTNLFAPTNTNTNEQLTWI